jgi:signal peptidase I
MLGGMSHDRKSKIAIVAVNAVFVSAMVAMYVLNPFNTASDDPRARILGFTVYRVPSRSMEPTIRDGQILFVSAIALRNRDPAFGEVVVFRYPPDPEIAYLKRVVAHGGTTIEMRHGALHVGGEAVDEPWLPPEPIRTVEMEGRTIALREHEIYPDFAPLVVPPGHFFVLGDNRGNSEDSRAWGFVPRENMIGVWASD